tara:strand:- start:793 stop:1119 length:327 start_codon:yes stop_codon:yes gene_type:complete
MKKFNLISFILITFLILPSCQTLKKGFQSQKKYSTDEFLVEKKSPLVMPPEFSKLPSPEVIDNEAQELQNNDIKKLITNNENSDTTISNSTKKNKNFENSILEKIRKN